MPEQLAASELLPEQSPLDKALSSAFSSGFCSGNNFIVTEEIVEKIDIAEKTCEKLMIYDTEEQDTRRVTPKSLKNIHGRNFKGTMVNF